MRTASRAALPFFGCFKGTVTVLATGGAGGSVPVKSVAKLFELDSIGQRLAREEREEENLRLVEEKSKSSSSLMIMQRRSAKEEMHLVSPSFVSLISSRARVMCCPRVQRSEGFSVGFVYSAKEKRKQTTFFFFFFVDSLFIEIDRFEHPDGWCLRRRNRRVVGRVGRRGRTWWCGSRSCALLPHLHLWEGRRHFAWEESIPVSSRRERTSREQRGERERESTFSSVREFSGGNSTSN